jgi:zinc protease
MRRLPRALVLATLALSAAASGKPAEKPAPAGDKPLAIPFEKYTLPNGLTVILSEDHRLPLVAVNVWYHVGPVREPEGRTGFAHLFEHLMFKGSQHVPDGQHFAILEAAGASSINGTTDFDRTNYFETVPSNQLATALWMESDRMGFLLPVMSKDKLDNQRDVVQNERRQRIENVPYGLADEKVVQLLFPPGHPYFGNVMGSHKDLEAVELPDVLDFFKHYYAPSNASISICGDFKPAVVKELVARYFGPIPRGPELPPTKDWKVELTKEKRETMTDAVQLPRIYFAWLSPSIFKPGDAELDLLAKILAGGKSSRLYKDLVYDKKIAQDVSAVQYSLILTSMFRVEVTAKPGHTLAEIEAEVDRILDDVRKDPASADELQRAKRVYQAAFIRGLESVNGKADHLSSYEHYLGDPGSIAKDLARYTDATAEGIRDVAAATLPKNKRVVVMVTPAGEKPKTVPKPPVAPGKPAGKPAPQPVNSKPVTPVTKTGGGK